MVVITKDIAAFIRKKLPNACIRKTMSGHTSERGKYYVELTRPVQLLLDEYNNNLNVLETYPFE